MVLSRTNTWVLFFEGFWSDKLQGQKSDLEGLSAGRAQSLSHKPGAKMGWTIHSILSLVVGCLLVSAVVATGAGECPLVIGVASTPGRPDVFKSYIGGEWRVSSSGKTLKVLSPVNETSLFEVQVRVLCLLFCSPRHVELVRCGGSIASAWRGYGRTWVPVLTHYQRVAHRRAPRAKLTRRLPQPRLRRSSGARRLCTLRVLCIALHYFF